MDLSDLVINGGPPVTDPESARQVWPRITREVEEAVVRQLYDSTSIRDRSGVFAEFEDEFRLYYDRSYGLLSNSGTSAIFSMYEGSGLAEGDEIVAPAYGFSASVSPLLYLGATPAFADTDLEGHLTAAAVEEALTPRSRGVLLTHVRGVPAADTERIAEVCKARDLLLFEDCSHRGPPGWYLGNSSFMEPAGAEARHRW